MSRIRTKWLSEHLYPNKDALIALNPSIYYIYKTRQDLNYINIETEEDRLWFLCWWESIGHIDYPDTEWNLSNKDDLYFKKITPVDFISKYPRAVLFWLQGWKKIFLDKYELLDYEYLTDEKPSHGNSIMPLPMFLELIWSQRSDIKEEFNISTTPGCFALVNWWLNTGSKEYKKLYWRPSSHNLSRLMRLKENSDASKFELPFFLFAILNESEYLKNTFDINTEFGKLQLLNWWQVTGKLEYPFIEWSLEKEAGIISYLLETSKSQKFSQFKIPNFLEYIFEERKDLHVIFGVANINLGFVLMRWWHEHGLNDYLGLSLLQKDSNLFNDFALQLQGCDYIESHAKKNIMENENKFGVNVIGFAFGSFGLGEDVRMATRVLKSINIPSAVIDVPIPGPAKLDKTVNEFVSKNIIHNVNLYCLPPTDMMRLSLEGGRHLINTDTYNVGAWPWELASWPKEFNGVHEFVNEIWAHSTFVEKAFKSIGDTPVIKMPMAVEIPKPNFISRSSFGLNNSDFLFYILFDGSSWLSRKNPLASIYAYLRAFPETTAGVGLVIKVMNVYENNTIWMEVLRLVSTNPNIKIINQIMTRQDTIDLMNCCDAYISLHRSEGFGRVIAESMLLGKPTIVSNYSGNVDFCTESTAYIVGGEMTSLSDGDYVFYEDQSWFDPDINTASELMCELYEDNVKREDIIENALSNIKENYSIEAVSMAYKERLLEIKKIVN